MSSNALFCPKPQNIQLTTVYDIEQQQILTFEQLEPVNIWHFLLKNVESTIWQIS